MVAHGRCITRPRYTEEFMAELATHAMKHWDALEKDAGVSLRWMGGLLNFGDKDMGSDTPEGKRSVLFESMTYTNRSRQEPCWGPRTT